MYNNLTLKKNTCAASLTLVIHNFAVLSEFFLDFYIKTWSSKFMEPDSRFVPGQLDMIAGVGEGADGEEAFLSIRRIIVEIHWAVRHNAYSG